ncbi:hypothetical protein BaRGS_00009204 [Batillaria attramentaria]|uniref:Uncharacterized protein n=1 Tax=Batillaria attramentaria TaxID=370345 RepID=A0ABD0LJR3_9CAEN
MLRVISETATRIPTLQEAAKRRFEKSLKALSITQEPDHSSTCTSDHSKLSEWEDDNEAAATHPSVNRPGSRRFPAFYSTELKNDTRVWAVWDVPVQYKELELFGAGAFSQVA